MTIIPGIVGFTSSNKNRIDSSEKRSELSKKIRVKLMITFF